MVAHHRLENALARAEELITVGNQSAALQLLHDAIISRWFQHNLLALDAIMAKFVELCVELRRGRLAKDGLHQYRSISQNVNVAGLESVMMRFLGAAEGKLAVKHSEATAEETVEDLEQVPETLASVWGTTLGDEKERTGHEAVTPWLRFVWEVYRIILDICRHNNKLESVYRVIVERAFIFCRKYGRKAEFRRLCEILRHHLSIINKYPGQTNGISLSEPASHQLQLELRFEQLAVATEMELWHEAFRSIEDIHGLFVLARKSAKPALVMTYYERLCRVFQMSNNYLYLAATLCKLFSLAKSQNDEYKIGIDATMAVLATVASPLLHDHDATNTMTLEETEAKNTRLAHFLGLQKAPSRSGVLKELFSRDILPRANETAQKLFNLLETTKGDFDTATVEKHLQELEQNPQFSAFVPAIYKNIVALIFKKISQTGKVETFEALEKKIAMPSLSIKEFNLDAFIIEGCRSGDFHLRIDHETGVVRFKKPCFAVPPKIEINNPLQSKTLQVISMIEEACKKISFATEQKPKIDLDELVRKARANLDSEQKANLARKTLIEKKKEILEEIAQRKEREEARERAVKVQQEKEAEKIRLAEETAKREAARREAEREEIRRDQEQKREEEVERKKEAAARRANLEKMIAVVRRLDHLERAYRQEEIPLLTTDYEKQKKDDRVAYDERTVLIHEKAKSQFEAEIQLKANLTAMSDDYKSYVEGLKTRRQDSLEAKKAKAAADLETAKEARRERARTQAATKREVEERRRADEEQRAKEEEERIAKDAALSKAYVPPSKRNVPETASSPFGSRSASSPFGAQSSSGGGAFGGGSWRRA
ncbi:Eukaryotic translation initiation factor 3 subunit A [Paramicrosporidium saccamoebae]|uniref:Eukaryotic translation initiation factor 3 subunit A n=1 Tax=Paramicrosporidium saccamoebae TaxID=1246581 RepID=A0A2H9TIQ2_9FUNG|nr:Eukaryotic translation initiation factor 3 subunit A [Paramicrosporidium saccamoebae]